MRGLNSIALIDVFIVVLGAIMFLITGCKPQHMVTEKESSEVLELKDSLMIKKTDIALINTVTNRFLNEGFNLVNEVVIHEVEYDDDCRVSLERFINSSTRLENSIEDYEVSLEEASIESSYLAQRSNSLQFETEGITKEESKQRSTLLSLKVFFVLPVVVVALVFVCRFKRGHLLLKLKHIF